MTKKYFLASLLLMATMGSGTAYGQFTVNQWSGAGADSNWSTNANWQSATYTSGSNAGIAFSVLAGKQSETVNHNVASAWTRYLILGDPSETSSTNYTISNGTITFKYAYQAGYPETNLPAGSTFDFSQINADKTLAIWAAGTGTNTVNSNIVYDSSSHEKKGFLIRNDSSGTLTLGGSVTSLSVPTTIDGSGKTRINNLELVGATLTNSAQQSVDFYGTLTSRGVNVLAGAGDATINKLAFGTSEYYSNLTYQGTGALKIVSIEAIKTDGDGANQFVIGANNNSGVHTVEVTGDINFGKGVITIFGTDMADSANMLTISGEGSTINAAKIVIQRAGDLENGVRLGAVNVQANTTITSEINLNWNGGLGVADGKTAILTGNLTCADGTKTVSKYGGGTLALQGTANTVGQNSGNLNIEAGTVRLDSGSNLSTKTVNIKNNGVLELAGGTYSGNKVNVDKGAKLKIDNQADAPTDWAKYTASDRSILSVNYGGANDWTQAQILAAVPNSSFKSLGLFHLELNVSNGANATFANSITNSSLALNLGAGSTYTTSKDTETLSGLKMNTATLNAKSGGSGNIELRDVSVEKNYYTSVYVSGAGTSTINANTVYMALGNHGHFVIDPESTLVVNAALADSSTNYSKNLYLEGGGTLELKKAATYTGDTYVENGTLKLSVAKALLKDKNLYISENGVVDLAVDGSIAWDNAPAGIYINGGKLLNSCGNHITLGAISLDEGILTSYVNGTSLTGNATFGNFILDKTIAVSGTGTSLIEAKTVTLRKEAASGRSGGPFNVSEDATLKLDATFRPYNAEETAITLTGGGTILLGANFKATDTLKVKIQSGTLDISEKNLNSFASTENWSLISTAPTGSTADINSVLTLSEDATLSAGLTLNPDGSFLLPSLYVNGNMNLAGSSLLLNLVGDGWEASMLDGLSIIDADALGKVVSQFSNVLLSDDFGGSWAISANGKLTQGVPEPSSVLLLILGAFGLSFMRRRKR